MRSKMTTFGIGFLCVFQLTWLWLAGGQPNAFAQEAETPEALPKSFVQVCRAFTASLDEQSAAIDTGDRLTEIGQWVGEHEDKGFRLHNVDFEVGQKRTGYPQGWVYVCVTPASNPASMTSTD